jgi:hypothetical protein
VRPESNAQRALERERERLVVGIATIVINVVAVSLLTFAPWSDWRTGMALNIINNCLLVGVTAVRPDQLAKCGKIKRSASNRFSIACGD